jgi:hypothetical protein
MAVEHVERNFVLTREESREIIAKKLGFDPESKDEEITLECAAREDIYLILKVKSHTDRTIPR